VAAVHSLQQHPGDACRNSCCEAIDGWRPAARSALRRPTVKRRVRAALQPIDRQPASRQDRTDRRKMNLLSTVRAGDHRQLPRGQPKSDGRARW
jgi:hypothetical protein